MASELELANHVQRVLQKNLVDFHGVLASVSDPAAKRYGRLVEKHPLWPRARLVKFAIKKPINKAAELGAAAGGIAFLPGVGSGLSIAAIVGSSLKFFSYCVEASDTVALSHSFDMNNDEVRSAARLCVLYWTIPAKARPDFSPAPPSTSAELMTLGPNGRRVLLAHTDEIMQRWGAAVATWRLSAAAPFGVGAVAGIYSSFLPIKLSVRSAELFYASKPAPELMDIDASEE
jgi:hypothetical protein